MAENETGSKKTQFSDEAVRAATGKGWDEWFSLIDAASGRELTHQQIVAYLREQHGVPPWWQQNITNTYEQYIERRGKHEMPEGFQISRSRTLLTRLPDLWAAWTDDSARGAWLLQGDFQVRKATPGKSLRLLWGDGSRVDITFAPKSDTRSTVTIQHSQLPNAEEAERRKAYWSAMLDRLEKYLSRSPLI